MLKAVIVEDEQLSVEELTDALREVAPWIEVVAVARSVRDAVPVLRNTIYDLVFMDVNLGDGVSFDIFRRLEVGVPVIFITAYDTYALKAFQNKGIDYLLKPFGHDDLRRALDKLRLVAPGAGPGQQAGDGGAHYRERFLVTVGEQILSVRVDQIAYFMADGKLLHLVTHEGDDYLVDHTLGELSYSLPPHDFFRINRKFIVSFTAIREMVRYSGTRIRLTLGPPPAEGADTIVSTDRVRDFRRWLDR